MKFVTKLNLAFAIYFFVTLPLMAQSPGGLGNQTLWLAGDFNGKAVKAKLLNFNFATAFDEGKDNIQVPHDLYQLGQATIFTVYEEDSPGTEKSVWEMTGEFGDVLLSTESVSSEKRNSKMNFSPKGVAPFVSEIPGAIINTYTRRLGNRTYNNENNSEPILNFGSSNNINTDNQFSGLIAEFILFERILKEKERDMVESYLALKYGVSLQKNYINTAGETVWNWEQDEFFSNYIIGIGRDDKSVLYQKQSTTGKLTIAAHEVANSNHENTAVITDQTFLVCGNNAKPMTLEKVNNEKVEMELLSKKWLMKASGTSANTLATELSIDITSLLASSFPIDRFCLIIDRSGSNSYTPESIELLMPKSISSDGIASFSELFWDTDKSGKDAFTFGLKPEIIENDKIKMPPGFDDEKNIPTDEIESNVQVFKEYPNPSYDGNYNVLVSLKKTTDIEIQVYDMHERLLHTRKGEGLSEYLFSDFINGVPGVYTIVLITPEEEISRKIIVE